jgi:ATP/ADP translocase
MAGGVQSPAGQSLCRNVIPESTLILMAGLLPVVVLTSLILTGAIVLFGFAAFANERKYIALIQRMTGHPGTPK